MFILMALVYLAAKYLDISVLGLLGGFSIFLLSIAVESVRYLSTPQDETDEDTN